MSTRRAVTTRFCLSLAAALAIASLLAMHRGGAAPEPVEHGVVFVYFPSLCAAPGDPRDCHEIRRLARPAFASMAACSAFADRQLHAEHNPRLMASCMKEREL